MGTKPGHLLVYSVKLEYGKVINKIDNVKDNVKLLNNPGVHRFALDGGVLLKP